jgi:hypothetical protein
MDYTNNIENTTSSVFTALCMEIEVILLLPVYSLPRSRSTCHSISMQQYIFLAIRHLEFLFEAGFYLRNGRGFTSMRTKRPIRAPILVGFCKLTPVTSPSSHCSMQRLRNWVTHNEVSEAQKLVGVKYMGIFHI